MNIGEILELKGNDIYCKLKEESYNESILKKLCNTLNSLKNVNFGLHLSLDKCNKHILVTITMLYVRFNLNLKLFWQYV